MSHVKSQLKKHVVHFWQLKSNNTEEFTPFFAVRVVCSTTAATTTVLNHPV